MAKLWASEQGGSAAFVDRYTAADDAILDNHLVEMDIYTNAAHVRMLADADYMSLEERDRVLTSLTGILGRFRSGGFRVEPEDEDVHTKIENTVTGEIGEAGQRIHTGRSRNDQVLTDMRLFCKMRLDDTAAAAYQLAEVFLTFARMHIAVPMPGYTHMQRGMPSSVGLWAGAFAEALLDDLRHLQGVYSYIDTNPLGSGAGYGITLNIDREKTRRLLGFSRLQSNSIYCQNSRGKMDGAVLSVLSGIMLTLGRVASDLLLFTTSEYAFFSVEDSLTTGSSIMPQKKNLDIMELLRGRVRTVLAAEALVKSIPASLPSGYGRDLQETKRPLIDSFQTVVDSIQITALLLKGLCPDPEALKRSMTPDLYATDDVFALVSQGIPFREAYRRIKATIASVPERDPSFLPDSTATPGTPLNPDLKGLEKNLQTMEAGLRTQREGLRSALESLLQVGD